MDSRLLEQLVCPLTKGPLILQKVDTANKTGVDELISLSARLAYPIRDGIAVMMEADARVISEDEYNALREKHPARI